MGGWRGPPGLVTASPLCPVISWRATPAVRCHCPGGSIRGRDCRRGSGAPPRTPTVKQQPPLPPKTTPHFQIDHGQLLKARPRRGIGDRRSAASRGRSFYPEPQAPPKPARCTPAASRHARAELRPDSPGLFVLLSLKPPLAEQVRKQQSAHSRHRWRSRPARVTTADVRWEVSIRLTTCRTRIRHLY
jgi:hypothetical protein